jgi:hypothetical protein
VRRVTLRLIAFTAVLAASFGGAYALGNQGEPVTPHEPGHEMQMTPGETMP